MLAIGAIIGEFAAGAMSVGLLFGVVGSKIGGTRRIEEESRVNDYKARTAYWRTVACRATGLIPTVRDFCVSPRRPQKRQEETP